jgi:hypothetical protein
MRIWKERKRVQLWGANVLWKGANGARRTVYIYSTILQYTPHAKIQVVNFNLINW